VADFALLLRASDKQAGMFNLMAGANTYAGGLLCGEEESLSHILEEIEKESIRALILVETDPFWRFPDRQRLERALDKLELLVTLDYLNSQAVQKAHIFLPTATIYEAGGLYANQEGRVQYAPPAFAGGKPIAQIGDGDHPPRIYDAGLPDSDLRAASRTLIELADEALSTDETKAYESIWKLLPDGIPEFNNYASADQIPEDGFHLGAGVNPDLRFNLDRVREKEHSPAREEGFELLLTDWTFGTEELSSLSPCLIELEREPCLVMHVDDAKDLGCTDGDFVEITTELGSLQVMVALDQAMASGVLCLPRHPRLPWRIFKDMEIAIKKDQIKKRV
jgi:NADH-quinone oxidoreductase subunit G